MSSISVSSLVLGSLTVELDGTDSTLALSVLATAPAVLSVELGTPGAQGPAATIAVGTTSTLSPGAAATVVNAGTSSAAVFNFGIPAGLKGDTGNTGATGAAATIAVGSTSTGAAGSSASVANSGTSSAAVFDFTIPRGDKGDKGDTGNTGATGSQGPAGTAATATAGTTTTGAPGTSASVVNAGTSSAAVFNFTIPRGDVGATGATGATGAVGPGVAAGGSTGMFLQKASGTNYDTTWATIVPGDRYLTTSTTSLTIGNGSKSLTVGTGLSYTTTQNVTITFDASNHMHGEVLTYNAGTGAMTVNVNHHTGSGTYSAWVVNVGGVTPVTSTTWGTITGTLSSQVDLQGSLDAKLAKASNLSDLTNASTARTNLGLGTAAVEPATKLVPAGGTTGQVLTKLSNADWDDGWATPSAGGGGVNVQEFGGPTSSGTFTWTKPANAKMVYVWMVGGGAGGGSGARRAISSARGGGGGGGGGNTYARWFNAAGLGATETVTVGTGVTGAAGITVNDTNGATPATSTTVFSAFGGFRTYGSYGGGGGGTTGGGTGNTTGNHLVDFGTIATVVGVAGLNGTTTDNSNFNTSYHGGLTTCGGGGGAGQNPTLTASTMGSLGIGMGAFTGTTGPGLQTAIAGGTRGQPSPLTPAGNGVSGGFSSSFTSFRAGTGGGGGYYISGQPGGTGGNGGWPGGGGGGGGASDNGQTSGAGGNGANGIVVVITYS